MRDLDPIDGLRLERGASDAPEGLPRHASPSWLTRNLPLSLDAYEKAALERALIETWGDASEAARLLGIGRSTFYRKAGKHGIHLGRDRLPEAAARSGHLEGAPSARPGSAAEEEPSPQPVGVGVQEPLG